MNFFRKKNSVYISLDAADATKEVQHLWQQILEAMEPNPPDQIRFEIVEGENLSVSLVGVMLSFVQKMRERNMVIQVVAAPRVQQILQRLHLSIGLFAKEGGFNAH